MAIKCAWASIDERGKASGGKAGDQTGGEVKIGNWYQFGQNVILRSKTKTAANKIAASAKACAENKHIGYDQAQRATLYKAWSKIGITKSPALIKTNCETDCSEMTACCILSASIKISPDCWTGNLRAACKETGKFTILTDSKYLKSDAYLKKGDIILNEKSHVIIALENGSKVSVKKTTKSKTTSQTTTPKSHTSIIGSGKVVARSGLNVRNKASKSGKVVDVLTRGKKVSCYAKKKEGSRTWWAINSAKTKWSCASEGKLRYIK